MRNDVVLGQLDEFGSILLFSRPTQLYYSTDALVWGGATEAGHAELVALEALEALRNASAADRGGFGNEQGVRCDLAVARLFKRDVEGAIEAVAPVFDLPSEQRNSGS